MVVCDEGRGNEKEEKKGKEKMGKKGMYEVQIFCRVRIKGRMNWEGGLCPQHYHHHLCRCPRHHIQ